MYVDMPDSNPKSSIRDQIDENLKRIYDQTLQEQIPEKLTRLLDQLRQKTAAPKAEDDLGQNGGQSA